MKSFRSSNEYRYAIGFILAFVCIAVLGVVSRVQAAEYPLTGWLWSSNIGWISMSSTNSGAGGSSYGVTIDDAGKLKGYAWTPNAGWLSFNSSDVSGCGDSTLASCDPQVTYETGKVLGWARFINGIGRTDGWNGWLQLSDSQYFKSPTLGGNGGVTYDNTARVFRGYAWGSPAIGWIDFNSVACPTCQTPSQACVLETVPSVIHAQNTPVTVNWYSNPGSTCVGSGFSTGNLSEGSTQITVSGETQLSVTCTNAAQTASKQCYAFIARPGGTNNGNPGNNPTQPPPPTTGGTQPGFQLQGIGQRGGLANNTQTLTVRDGEEFTLKGTRLGGGDFTSCTLSNSLNANGWGGKVSLTATERNPGQLNQMVGITLTQSVPVIRYTMSCEYLVGQSNSDTDRITQNIRVQVSNPNIEEF